MKKYGLFAILLFAFMCGYYTYVFFNGQAVDAKNHQNQGNDKDKEAPEITELLTETTSHDSTTVRWLTNEPADSAIRYGIDPKTNNKGPAGSEFVTEHSLTLSNLEAETTYAFCVQSADENNNKTSQCGTFVTPAVIIPVHTGGGSAPKPRIHLSGFAYPKAQMSVQLHDLPFGSVYKEGEMRASETGHFSFALEDIKSGNYFIALTATDNLGVSVTKQTFQFKITSSAGTYNVRDVYLPPTLYVERDILSWGDNILIMGHSAPKKDVVIEVDENIYKTVTDSKGKYELDLNSAQFAPGKITLRARSPFSSISKHNYSISKNITLTLTSIPEADLNKDGEVNIIDLSAFLGDPIDINGDGKVNATDVSIFLPAFIRVGQ